jgi:hypothetical protein
MGFIFMRRLLPLVPFYFAVGIVLWIIGYIAQSTPITLPAVQKPISEKLIPSWVTYSMFELTASCNPPRTGDRIVVTAFEDTPMTFICTIQGWIRVEGVN